MASTLSGASALSLREQGKLDKSNRIRIAGEQLFREKDFAEVTTKEIAARAGVGEATFFRYVSSKIELLLMIYGDKMEKVLEDLEARDDIMSRSVNDAESCLRRVYAIYEARAQFYKEDPANAALYLREAFQAGSSAGSRGVVQGDRCIRLATDILRDGQRAGVLMDKVDAKIIAQNCHGIFIHEVDRTPVRGFSSQSITERVFERLSGQLEPLVLHSDR